MYEGSFKALVPLIEQLHAMGKTPIEIAVEAPPVIWGHGQWATENRISPTMVKYILKRLKESNRIQRGHYYDASRPEAVKHNQAYAADFKRRWDKWETTHTTHEMPDGFLAQARRLYALAGWIADEIEKRRFEFEM